VDPLKLLLDIESAQARLVFAYPSDTCGIGGPLIGGAVRGSQPKTSSAPPSSFPARYLILIWSLVSGVACLISLGCNRFDEQGAVKTLGRHPRPVCLVAFSPDGKTLVSVSDDPAGGSMVKIWDPETGVERGTLPGRFGPVRCLVFSPDGKTLALGLQETLWSRSRIMLWETGTWQNRLILKPGQGAPVLAFAPDGKTLASKGPDSSVLLWDPTTGELKQTLQGPPGYSLLAFSPDGRTLAMGGWGREVKLWDVPTNRERASFTVPTTHGSGRIEGLAFIPDSGLLVTGGHDGGLRFWDVSTAQQVALWNHGQSDGLIISPNGKLLANWRWPKPNDPNLVFLEDLQGKKVLTHFEVDIWAIHSMAFSPDSNMLATGSSSSGLVQLWDVRKLLSRAKQ
jgi:WD40 repeat protein